MRLPPRFSLASPGYALPVMNKDAHAPDVRVCPSCHGRKVDRFDFDCTTCLGEGTVDE